MSIRPSPVKMLTMALVVSSMPAAVLADTFTSVVVYGDSLSDNGNLFAVSGQPGLSLFRRPPIQWASGRGTTGCRAGRAAARFRVDWRHHRHRESERRRYANKFWCG